MSQRVQRDFRRQANQVANKVALLTMDSVAPSIAVALGNEALTRERVDKLEATVNRPILGRLKWLVTGR